MDTVLVVDDEPDIRELLEVTLKRMNLKCRCAQNLQEAMLMLDGNVPFSLCLTDMRLPDGDGIQCVEYVQQHCPRVPVAVITAYGNMESAIRALKAGAFDFLCKPVKLPQLRQLIRDAQALQQPYGNPTQHVLIGKSASIRELKENAKKLARSQVPVYLSGESGVGKELVARMIHDHGPRRMAPFVPVNCGAIPHDLVESELFGYKKGSFTSAVTDREGLFRAAEGGTLFFDELAALPLSVQVKLLRAVQERSIRPIGERHEFPIDVRILSATNDPLEKLVRQGRFRQDLYYRINVVNLRVPSLREHKEDVPLLVEHLLQRAVGNNERLAVVQIDDQAMDALQAYSYPGNVRELENIINRAVALCEGNRIRVEDLRLAPELELEAGVEPAEPEPVAGSEKLDDYLGKAEKKRILEALEQTRWNRTRAAKLLGLSLRALRYRLEKLRLE